MKGWGLGILCGLIASTIVLGEASAVARKPDLKVNSVSFSSGSVAVGEQLLVNDAIRNKGGRAARRSETGFFLSLDAFKDASDTPFADQRDVPRLAPKQVSVGDDTELRIPIVSDGLYHVIACADVEKQIREQRERNNCRASANQLTVDSVLTVVSASAPAGDRVVVTFNVPIAPASVDADGSQFTFDNGLTATAAVPSRNEVTVTTNVQVWRTVYGVSVADSMTDEVGDGIGAANYTQFAAFVPPAALRLNEVVPDPNGSRDLLELVATSSGTISGVVLQQVGDWYPHFIESLPDIIVSTNDIIVVHVKVLGHAGAAPDSETTSPTEYPNSAYSLNHDGAWDIYSVYPGLGSGDRLLTVHSDAGDLIDVVALTDANGSTLDPFEYALRSAQLADQWLPATCSAPCNEASVPTAEGISVVWNGIGTLAGNSLSRKPGIDTNDRTDWEAVATHSFGLPNP